MPLTIRSLVASQKPGTVHTAPFMVNVSPLMTGVFCNVIAQLLVSVVDRWTEFHWLPQCTTLF